MEFTIEAKQLKVFAKACLALSKVSEDSHIEVNANTGIIIRSVGPGRSAYYIFYFHNGFFSKISLLDPEIMANQRFRRKIFTKYLQMLFKNLPIIERSVQTCIITFDKQEDSILFILCYTYGAKRTFRVGFDEEEPLLNHEIEKNYSANSLLVPSRILEEFIRHFHVSSKEMTLVCSMNSVAVNNFACPTTEEENKSVRTQISFLPADFEEFQIKFESAISFTLKSFKPFVSFVESFSLSSLILFSNPGKPVTFSTTPEELYHVELILPTSLDTNDPENVTAECDSALVDTSNQRSSVIPSNASLKEKHVKNLSIPPRRISQMAVSSNHTGSVHLTGKTIVITNTLLDNETALNNSESGFLNFFSDETNREVTVYPMLAPDSEEEF